MAFNWFKKLKNGLSKSASKVENAFKSVIGKKSLDEQINIMIDKKYEFMNFVKKTLLIIFLSLFYTGQVSSSKLPLDNLFWDIKDAKTFINWVKSSTFYDLTYNDNNEAIKMINEIL